MAFTHLHVHTEFSLLDGSNKIKEYVKRVKELGMTSAAITDHGVMYGCIDFYKEAKAQGIKPIMGCEVYVAPNSRFDKELTGGEDRYYHLVLLAENDLGYQNLMKIVSKGFTEGYYYKPRVDMEVLREYHEGIIALSACLAGEVQRYIMKGLYEDAKKQALKYLDCFGEGNYFLELQDHGMPEQATVNTALMQMSKELNIPLVATNDVHYTYAEDVEPHDLLLCIQTGKKVTDEDRMRYEGGQYYVKSEEEMRALFPYAQEALDNTAKIAERCNVEIRFHETKLPHYEVPEGYTSVSYLHKLCEDGFAKHYPNDDGTLMARMKYELEIIEKMGYVDYFLIVWDFINFAKSNDIMVGPGRGSAAGSIVSYCLHITNIDPIRYQLLFERFLNPERISMPDIDIDFCVERRQEVIDYVGKKYGAEKVVQIVTFGTMAARNAIRDVARVLDLPYALADTIAKMIPQELNITIKKALEMNPELRDKYENDFQIKHLIDMSMRLEGLPRNTSMHAAGVLICPRSADDFVPLSRGGDGAITTQYTMTTLEELGLLKMDFLGLRNLTVIQNATRSIEKTKGIHLVMEDIDYNDKKVLDYIGTGKCDGVFQLESAGMKSFMKELKPQSLEDIIAGISLYRPGPMDFIPQYIGGKNNPEQITYLCPELEPILAPTYGCIVYQEQVMQIVRDLGGYTLGRSDEVRRAMSKKKTAVMEKEREYFVYGNKELNIPGCIGNGISADVGNQIYDKMIDFAKYAFNKSHAAAYAVVSYQTAYLKAHYPAEFMAATMNSFLGNLDKVPEYIAECKLSGIEVLRPDINESYARFAVINNKIRFALASIKNVGEAAIETIVRERKENGIYKDFVDFLKRVESEKVNKKCIESLILAGAFDELEKDYTRRDLLYNFENILDSLNQERRNNIKNQVNIFDAFIGEEEVKDTSLSLKKSNIDITKKEMLDMEKEMMGLYISGHPLDEYINQIAKVSTVTTKDLTVDNESEENDNNIELANEIIKKYDNTDQTICGIISSVKTIYTKSNRQMAFLLIEDLYGQMEAIVFPNVYGKYSTSIKVGEVLEFNGKISIKEGELPKILVNNVSKMNGYSKIYIKITGDVDEKEILDKVVSNIYKTEGNIPIYLYFEEKDEVKLLAKKWWTEIDEDTISTFSDMFGKDNVKLK